MERGETGRHSGTVFSSYHILSFARKHPYCSQRVNDRRIGSRKRNIAIAFTPSKAIPGASDEMGVPMLQIRLSDLEIADVSPHRADRWLYRLRAVLQGFRSGDLLATVPMVFRPQMMLKGMIWVLHAGVHVASRLTSRVSNGL